jgi:hypothetical protein
MYIVLFVILINVGYIISISILVRMFFQEDVFIF